MDKSTLAAAATALVLTVTACSQRNQADRPTADTSSQPELSQSAPADSTYSGAAGRTEDGAAASASATSAQEFVQTAAQTDLMEIEAGKLAAEKASSPEVKRYAGMLVKDHSKARSNLKQIAQEKGVEVPTTLPPDKQQSLEKLKGLSGAEFDRAFSQEMVAGHEQAIEMFQQAAQSQDPQIRTYAEQTLPTLRQHLKVAQALPGADNRG